MTKRLRILQGDQLVFRVGHLIDRSAAERHNGEIVEIMTFSGAAIVLGCLVHKYARLAIHGRIRTVACCHKAQWSTHQDSWHLKVVMLHLQQWKNKSAIFTHMIHCTTKYALWCLAFENYNVAFSTKQNQISRIYTHETLQINNVHINNYDPDPLPYTMPLLLC